MDDKLFIVLNFKKLAVGLRLRLRISLAVNSLKL